jgi:hypothetical protein
MRISRHTLGISALSAALITLIAYAAPPQLQKEELIEYSSADLPRHAAQRRLAPTALSAAAGSVAAAAAPTVEEVGDVDSFGRNVKWLGLANAFITLAPSCDDPDADCQVLNPSPGATAFNFQDTVSITLPGKSAHSLLCYWFSPVLMVDYRNETAARVTARLTYSPTLTVENEVLDDPALIDPNTGAPFGGQLLTSMTSSERFEVPMEPGVQFTERTRDSAVCIAGFLSRRALVDTYGLTETQAKEFFKKPTTVRLNVQGTTQHVAFASLIFGLRIVGD